ncbi:MAG: RidA family protein [Parvibaculaceae bacterium]
MSVTFQNRLSALGAELPPVPKAGSGFFMQAQTVGNLVFMSGQIPRRGDDIQFKGRIGDTLSPEEGYKAARLCALNLVVQLNEALGGHIDRVRRFLKLTVFVNSAPSFTDPSSVANGASELLVEIFGEAGRHARSAIGVATLPRGVSVEVEAIVEIAP